MARLFADGLEAGGEGVDVTGDHSETVAWLIGLADGPGDDGAAIASRVVLSAGLDLARPRVSAVKL